MAQLMNGNDGEVRLATVIQKVRNWTMNLEADEIETTNGTDGSDAQSFLAGRKGGTFTAEIYSIDTVADQVAGGAAIAVVLVARQGATDKDWSFNAVITSVQTVTNIPAGDAVLSTISGRIDGPVTAVQYISA